MDTAVYKKLGYPVEHITHLTTFEAVKTGEWNNKVFLNVGRLTPDKQHLMLLKIWKQHQSIFENMGWKLIIVGEGEEHETLANYIKENALHNVQLVGATQKIEEYYSKATCFLFPSRMEGFGMVLLEAMAYGLPCISFDCPSGPRDIVKDGKNGWLIPCYDENIFSERMKRLIGMPFEEYCDISKRAMKTVDDWPNGRVMEKWKGIFESET